MRQVLILLSAIGALLVLASCGNDASSVDVGVRNLDERHFLLQLETGFDLVEGTTISLRFEDGSISADAGCNLMSGGYHIDGNILEVIDIQTTAMGCDQPRHAQDQAFSNFLAASPEITFDGETLELVTSAVTMVFLDSNVADLDQR